jgi:xylan 1,4-beta-xylosidase
MGKSRVLVAGASAAAVAVCAAAALVVGAAAQGTVPFTANLGGSTYTLSFPMLASFGSSHGSTTLRADWRGQLAQVQRDTGVTHVRFHGVLDDDMSTLLDGSCNMFNVFSTCDYLLSIGVAPIVELSFMPALLASNASQTVFHYRGGISPPADWAAFYAFIRCFVQAEVARYGIDVVRTFRHEVWNEPNCGFYSQGDCCGEACNTQAAYWELYNWTATAVKSVDPLIPVGGPATAQTAWIPEFLQFVAANKLPCDFVSTHLYPTDPNVPTDRDGFAAVIAAAASAAAQAGLPLVVTEFNSGLGIDQADEPYSAAFVLHQLAALQGVANLDTLSYWTFSDIFEEQGFSSQPWQQGFGIQTIYGVPKPVYRAFQMMAQLPAAAAQVNSTAPGVVYRPGSATVGTVDVMVATSRAGSLVSVTALLNNFNTYGNNVSAQTVSVTFANLSAAAGVPLPTSATLELIDATHANARPVWEAAGSPLYPSPAEVAAELAASQLVQQSLALQPAAGGGVQATLTMQPQSVARVRFEYAAAAAGAATAVAA